MSDYNIPAELAYTADDEWVRNDGENVAVGVTDFAQEQLGDIVFVEVPPAGTAVTRGEAFGVIESVKAVSDLKSPVSGEVVRVNDQLEDTPEIVNGDCYGSGWMLEIRLSDPAELEQLLDADTYMQSIKERSD
jgi:glycine cleavage system H protein